VQEFFAAARAALDRTRGVTGVIVREVSGSTFFSQRPDEVFPAASVIKIPLVMALYADAAAGRISLEERVPVGATVGGTGILGDLRDVREVSLRDLAMLTIALSDNTATNRLIDRLGVARVDERMAEWGCARSKLARGMFDWDAQKRGLENVASPSEIAALLERLVRGELVDRATSDAVIAVLERTNRIVEAREVMDRLLADPKSELETADRLALEGQLLQREGKHSEAEALFTRALPGKDEFHRRHLCLFPIARSLDALGRHDDAWRVLAEAHASQVESIQRQSPQWAVRAMPDMSVTALGCDPADVAAWDHAGAPSTADSPVFVVGFPRSGTTLLELALDAHPQLKSMDEQRFVQDVLDDLVAAGAAYPQRLKDVSRDVLDRVRARYWERVAKKVKLAAGERLVDKNPLNILRLPVIRRVFPNARILLAVRHPCDVILSCYMQQFRAPDFALLCRSIESLALGFRRTFDYWYAQSALLAPAVHELRYEDFVRDIGSGTRAVADFLELPWTESMLRPAERAQAKGYISTPSYAQVTQPVNQKSVDRWRRYEKHFAGALPPLAPYLERWGYAFAGVNSK